MLERTAALVALPALMLAGATSSGAELAIVLVLSIPVLVFLAGRGLAVVLGAIG